jgi:hypothetical protein
MKEPSPSHLAYHLFFYASIVTFTSYVALFATKGEPFEDTAFNHLFRNQTEEWIGFLLAPVVFMFALHFRKRAGE